MTTNIDLFEHRPLRADETTTVRIDGSVRSPYKVNPMLFGKFCEHLGSNIYSGMEAQILLNPTFGKWSSSLSISPTISVTTSQDIIAAIAAGKGPAEYLFILGYAGWTQEQLEQELIKGSWLHVKRDNDILFRTPLQNRYQACLKRIGIDESQLYSDSGHC